MAKPVLPVGLSPLILDTAGGRRLRLPDGRLLTTEVGDQGFGFNNGQLVLWFPPFDRFPGPLGAFPRTDTPEAFAAYLKAEFRKWGELVRLSGAKVD